MTTAIVFPGQGSQQVGMGLDLHDAFPAARAVFQEVDEALGEPLSRLMFEGEESELTLTRNAQPALMAVSVALIRALEDEGAWRLTDRAAFVAGHSLGEYTALAAAGCLALGDAARLLRLRARPCNRRCRWALAPWRRCSAPISHWPRRSPGGRRGRVCVIGNDNAPGQVVVSGRASAVERAVALAPEHGIKRAVMLPVSAPFHSPLLSPAAETMATAFKTVSFNPLAVPVVSNVTACPVHEASDVPALLVRQVTAMVRWRESVLHMASAGVDTLIEVGAGKVLTGLARRIDGA